MTRTLTTIVVGAAIVLAIGHLPRPAWAASVDAIAVDDDESTKGGQAGWGTGEGDTTKEAGAEEL